MGNQLLDRKADADGALQELDHDGEKRRISFVTGLMAAPMLDYVRKLIDQKFPGHENIIYGIRNDFFGEHITVAGLVTGQDILKQMKGKDLGDLLIVPGSMLRSGEDVFLDDLHITDVQRELQVPVAVLKNGGDSLVRVMAGILDAADFDSTHGEYELKLLQGEQVYAGRKPERKQK